MSFDQGHIFKVLLLGHGLPAGLPSPSPCRILRKITRIPRPGRAGRKAKLTVTIDEELIPKAKEQARSQGVSLSDFIERALRGLILEKRRPFSARWRGRFKAARRKDDRYEALAERYL